MAGNNVRFYSVDLKSKYDALAQKDVLALYWIEETKELYKGDILYGTGSEASEKASGLLSSADYIELKKLIAAGGSVDLVPVDASIVMSDGKFGVQISKEANNGIELKTDGLYAVKAEPVVVPEYTLEKQSTPTDGSAATYKLKRTVGEESSYVGDTIEINKDIAIKGGTMETVVEANVPYVGAAIGDPYIDLVLSDASETHLYIPCKELVDTVKAGQGIDVVDNTVSIKLSAVEGNALSIASDGGLFTPKCDFTEVEKAILNSISDVYASIGRVKETAVQVEYEISSKPEGTLVNYGEKEIRVMCPANTVWKKQAVGNNGDSNKYYMGFKAYAPENAVSFKESERGVVSDEMFYFVDNDFAGTDEYGRKYSIVWLPLASYDESNDTWTYFGKNSSIEKYIGWDYVVEWYDANGICIKSDSIRINLSNEGCYHSSMPYYMSKYATEEKLNEVISEVQESMTWGEL